jgi:hypothetical protein
MSFTREELLAVVRRSPATVALHDKEGWLGLFGESAYIEDPIGSPRADKRSGLLAKFWDTFIQPHQIEFEVLRDVHLGHDVMRDVVIHTKINERVQIDVPAYLLYQLEEKEGQLQVRRMAAHWELAKLSLGALKLGPRAWWPMTRLFANMIGRMGIGWVGGYLASLWSGIGKRGRLAQLTADSFDADAEIVFGGEKLTPQQLIDRRPLFESPVVAGWTATFRFPEGLGVVEFSRRSKKISMMRLFVDQEMKGKSALRSAG